MTAATTTNASKGKTASAPAKGENKQSRKSKDAESESGPTLRISMDMILADYEFNPRKKDRKTEEYVGTPIVGKSMLAVGQLQAVTVMKLGREDMKRLRTDRPYFLVFGFTRHDAALNLGWKEIKATVGEWETVQAAKLANMAENVAREDLPPYDKAVALHDLLEKEQVSVRKLAESIGQKHHYVTDLTNFMKHGNPMILDEWSKGHAKATIANLKHCISDAKRRDSHAKQMQAWMVLTHEISDTDGVESGEETPGDKESSPQNQDEIRRPTVKTVLKALEAVKKSDASKEYLKGVKAALRFAGILDRNIPHVWTQAVRDALKDADEKDAEERKAEKKEQKRQEKLADKK